MGKNEEFIKNLPKTMLNDLKCAWPNCTYAGNRKDNVKRHMLKCAFGFEALAECKSNMKKIEILVDESKYCHFLEDPNIISNAWGFACGASDPHNFKTMASKFQLWAKNNEFEGKSMSIVYLNKIICEGRIGRSVKKVNNKIHFYKEGSWISKETDPCLFTEYVGALQAMWFKKMLSLLRSDVLLWNSNIPLMNRLANEIGYGASFTIDILHSLIDDKLLEFVEVKEQEDYSWTPHIPGGSSNNE